MASRFYLNMQGKGHNTKVTRVGPGFRDQTLAVKIGKTPENHFFKQYNLFWSRRAWVRHSWWRTKQSWPLLTLSFALSPLIAFRPFFVIFLYQKSGLFLLFTASVWSRKPEPTLNPGVFYV